MQLVFDVEKIEPKIKLHPLGKKQPQHCSKATSVRTNEHFQKA